MYECCWPTLEVLVPGYAEVGSVCAGAAGQGLPGGHMTTWGNQTVATRLVSSYTLERATFTAGPDGLRVANAMQFIITKMDSYVMRTDFVL